MELSRLCVSVSARRQGVATLLVRTLEDHCKATADGNCISVHLNTLGEMASAVALYTRLGYSSDSEKVLGSGSKAFTLTDFVKVLGDNQ